MAASQANAAAPFGRSVARELQFAHRRQASRLARHNQRRAETGAPFAIEFSASCAHESTTFVAC